MRRRTLNKKTIALMIAAPAVGVPVALLLRTFSAKPLPAPPPTDEPLPRARPPAGMALYLLVTGRIHRRAGAAYRGGSFFERRESSVTAVLVKHPRGDLLIDSGFGRDIERQFKLDPLLALTTRYDRFTPAAAQLASVGYAPASLRAILLTHAHWDHVSGVSDFPETPVWISAEERRFIVEGGTRTAVARSAAGARYEEYGFDDAPYFGFPRSRDVYGDGAIVVVPAPGHTPGSVIIFVALPSGRRYAFVGDLVYQLEGITLRAERPWLMRRLVDVDEAAVRENLLRMIAIYERYPQITIVPAHDLRAYADIPRLGQARVSAQRRRSRASRASAPPIPPSTPR